MKKYKITGKIIGLISGLLVTGNFIGSLLATMLGHFLFDYKDNNGTTNFENEFIDDHSSPFKANILQSILSISVFFLLKVKNKILITDMNIIKEYFIEKFRFDMSDIVLIEKNILNLVNMPENINIKSVTDVVNQNCLYNEKVNIIELLFLIKSENFENDIVIISKLSDILNIKKSDFNLIKNRYLDYGKYFSILEIDENASLKDIKKAYRKLVSINHPDKANENYNKTKFQEIVDAYNILTSNISTGS